MQRNDIDQEIEREGDEADQNTPVEEAEHPIPGIEHYPEPDAENIMPVEDMPGTF